MTTKSLFKHSARWHVSWLFVLVALVCVAFADLSVTTLNPWGELGRFFAGLFPPSFEGVEALGKALLQTIAFAVLGVGLGSVVGFLVSLIFHWRWVRVLCALLRAVHELFWALIFLQIFGLHPLTGLLAIGIPYMATFAKVYSEILEEGDRSAFDALSRQTGWVSAFFYARLPDLWAHFKTYTSYRLECGLRSSAVLGFVGLPTLGYALSTAFMEGQYAQVWALLLLFYALIASIRYWVRPALLPIYVLIAPFVISNDHHISMANVTRFFTQDIIPSPILKGGSLGDLWSWFADLFMTQALPGLINTIVLSQIALVATGLLTLLFFPMISEQFFNRFGRGIGHLFLVMVRSTPEYILAFMLLLLWGPSMLPAIVALALHNAGIIGHLVGRYSNHLSVRQDVSSGLNRYSYEVLPRVYGQFLAFLFYRWEIIFRETAILGMLGVATLGFYIDSAISEIRLDRAMVLILITALLNVAVDSLSRYIRSRLRLSSSVDIR